MYKLILADDEDIIRKSLAEFIDWTAMGFDLVATFEDGKETIEYMIKNEVDVVLIDIKMTEVSGIEVAKYIHENKPGTRTVIISGYKEFEYAKKAIEYDVEYYILKPTKFEEIDLVFRKIKEKLDEEADKKLELQKDKEVYSEILPMFREQFFIHLIMGALRNQKEIEKRIRLLKLDIDPVSSPCCLINIRVRDYEQYLNEKWHYGRERLQTALSNFIKGGKKGVQYFHIPYSDNDLKVLAIASTGMGSGALQQMSKSYMKEISDSTKKMLNMDIEIYFEHCFKNIIELSKYNLPLTKEKIYNKDDEFILEPGEHKRLMEKYKLFMSNISEGNFEEVESLLNSFMDEIKLLPIAYVQRFIIDLFSMLSNRFSKLGLDLWKISQEQFDYYSIIKMTSIDEIRFRSKNILVGMMRHLTKRKDKSSQEMIKFAAKYIKENFSRDISLEEVSEQLFLNASYFSRLFKQEMGVTFIDYVTGIRIKKAMELLESGRYKAYEIGEMVGYKSSKYFFRVFKQYTGFTPAEHRRNVVKGSEDGSEG